MERLTGRSKQGTAYLVKVKNNEQVIESSKNTLECIYESFQRLSAYEDTGLSPEQVAELAKLKKQTNFERWKNELTVERFVATIINCKDCDYCPLAGNCRPGTPCRSVLTAWANTEVSGYE